MPNKNIHSISDFAIGSMPTGALSDSSPAVRPAASAASRSSSRPSSAAPLSFKVCHIPKTLSHPEQAASMLDRVVREFQPIITRRNYNVLSISELCCCGDGLDHEPTANGRKRRARKRMSNNVWGYNQISTSSSRYGKSHTIHLRLRHPTDHARFLPYEDVAGTLAHELAHCEHANHNEGFYKLMDEILDEHAALMASQLRMGGAPMAAFGGSGNTLGAATTNNNASGGTGATAATGAFTGTGNTLGRGDPSNNPWNSNTGHKLGGDFTFTNWMTPAEAAVAAAEARRRQKQLRLRGDHCCRPCTIDISSDEEEEEEDSKPPASAAPRGVASLPERSTSSSSSSAVAAGTKKDKKKKKRKTTNSGEQENEENRKPAAIVDIVDLTGDDTPPLPPQQPGASKSSAASWWSCHQCTFRNRPFSLACDMCQAQRNSHRFAK